MRLLILVLVFIPVVILFNCKGGVKVVENLDEDGNLFEKYSISTKNDLKQGTYYQYYSSGQVYEQANYHNDTLHGERKIFYESGQLQIVENYSNGNFEGPYLSYFENGNLESEGQYIDGKMAGEWKRYYKEGPLYMILTLEDNMENGPFTMYHPNGNLKEEGFYKNGDNLDGEFKIYDEEGELVRIMDCKMGRCYTRWAREKTE